MNGDLQNQEAIALMLQYVEGVATADQAAQLSAALRASPALRRECAAMLRQHLQLFEIAEELAQKNTADVKVGSTRSRAAGRRAGWRELLVAWRWRLAGGLAGAAALALAAVFWGGRGVAPNGAAFAGVEVEVKSAQNVIWKAGGAAPAAGQTVKVERLALVSGDVEFRISSGATIAASGPIDFEFLNPMQIRLNQGRLTAEIEPQAHGFTVLTPHGRVVDLGTKFGVDVTKSAGSDVVVFQGKVEVGPTESRADAPPPTRLLAGEAARLEQSGRLTRIESVASGSELNDWSARLAASNAVVTAVKDNHGDRWSYKFYPIVRQGMRDGVLAWPYEVNRPRWWSGGDAGLPSWLADADVVQTLNQELGNTNLQITIRLARPCALFVFYEDKSAPPDWLAKDFTDTGEYLKLSPDSPATPGDPGARGSYQVVFRVWKRTISAPGEYRVGAARKENVHTPPFYMYGLAAKASEPALTRL